MRYALLALLALNLFAAGAAQKLVVNGVDIAAFSTTLEPGTAYVAAEPFARAVGATYRYGGERVNFELAGRFVTLSVSSKAGDARLQEGTPYVPVKEVALRLGGEVDYLTAEKLVVVVFPRAQLRSVRAPDLWGRYERFVLRMSAPVAIEERFEPSLNTVRFRFERTDVAQKQNFGGERFSDAVLLPGDGYTDFTLTLARGSAYEMYTVPKGAGTEVVVDIFSEEEVEAEEEEVAPQVVLDSSPGDAATTAAERLRNALLERGLDARLTRSGGVSTPLGARTAAGIGAPLFVSIGDAPLEAGQFNLYYLADDVANSGTGLDAVIRQSAAEASRASPREPTAPQRTLQRLAPDLSQGERYADALGERLQAEGWRAAQTGGAPLYLLSGAAGRGLMLELSPADLASDAMTDTLADALRALLD